MDISIGSYKVSIEMLLLIVLMLWIIFGHALGSCSTMSLSEGFAAMKEGYTDDKPATKKKPKEGFTNNNSMFSDTQFATTHSPDYYMPPNEWAQQSLVYTAGQKPPPGVQAIWDRSKNQAPRKPGQISFFDNVNFKPECCSGSEYSSSMGCACLTVEDYKLLNHRGGNNVPYSEY